MRNYKRILAVLCTIALSLGLSVYAVAAESFTLKETQKEDAIQTLLEGGWTKEEIDDFMTDEALLQYAGATLVESSEKYLKVSENGVTEISKNVCLEEVKEVQRQIVQEQMMIEMTPSVSPQAIDEETTHDGYMVLNVQAFLSSVPSVYVLSARYEWLIEPDDRKVDVFGLGFSTQLTRTQETPYYVYKADVTKRLGAAVLEAWTYETSSGIRTSDSGGVAYSQQLYEDTYAYQMSERATNHRGYIQYKAKVNNTSATMASVYAEYFHQDTFFSVAPSVSYPWGASLSVTPSSKFVEMTPNPYLAFDV